MTDRAKALVVHLDDDYRIGDGDSGTDALVSAISLLRGVARVEPLVATTEDHFARERERHRLRRQIEGLLA